MKTEIKIPAMGESISEATVGAILKPSGSHVSIDDEILELETDKVNQMLYASQPGIVTITVKPEELVKIGQVIGFINSDTQTAAQPDSLPSLEPTPQLPTSNEAEVTNQSQKETSGKTESIILSTTKAEPLVAPDRSARINKDAFVKELTSPLAASEIKPNEKSAQARNEPQETRGARETRQKMSRVRKVIAERLVDVQHTAAMLTTFNEVDLGVIMDTRDQYKDFFLKEHGVKLGFMSFFVKATVSALKAFPRLNSYIDGDDIVHREYYDMGIAVATEKGLFVPVVRNCDKLSLADIERTIEEYANKARKGTITVDELHGGGFTITNGGVYGSLLSTPILNGNQSGILGMHKIEKRPVVINDQIVIRPMMYLALSYDHRIIDGKEAVSFLVHIKNKLEDPRRFLLEV